jgi:NTE family protein
MMKICKVGLALGGGGARGLAHVGVLRAFQREGIEIDCIAGTSMGALLGAMYTQSLDCDAVLERFRKYLQSKEFRKTNPEFLQDSPFEESASRGGIFHGFASLIKKGFFYSQSLRKRAPISEEDFAQNINLLLEDIRLEETRIPFAAVALDLNEGKEVVLRRGSMRMAVSASCAIPGILPPIKFEDRELVDGGWVDRVPVRPAREMGANLVIAVDVAEGIHEAGDLTTGLDIVLRTNEICQFTLSQQQLAEADIVIRPEMGGIHWSDFSHLDACVQAGEDATREKMPLIWSQMKRKKIGRYFPFLVNRTFFA